MMDWPMFKERSKKPTRFYVQLEKLLLEQLTEQPDSRDLRIQLLELYWETGREADFLREARVFRDTLRGNLDSPDWRMIASIGRSLSPSSPLFADSDGDNIAFQKPEQTPRQYRRLGEQEEHRKLFDDLLTPYEAASKDPRFLESLDRELLHIGGRPTSLFHADRLSRHLGGAQIYCKREELTAPGTNLMMAIVGQALFARRLGCKTLVTGTVYGQKGVLTASIAARLGMKAVVYMDGTDIPKQSGNVFRMWLSGALVESVDSTKLPSNDIREAALRHWAREPKDSFLVLGLDAGPEPYPSMCRDFVASIGRECRRQVMTMTRRVPDLLVARGSNCADAIGLFPPFIGDARSRLVCIDASSSLVSPRSAGKGDEDPFKVHGAPLTEQQQRLADAILEGLEYPSVTREHAWLRDSGRVEYVSVGVEDAKRAIHDFSRLEGYVPAIQTAHALAYAGQAARQMSPEQIVLVHINERVEKDIWDIGKAFGIPL